MSLEHNGKIMSGQDLKTQLLTTKDTDRRVVIMSEMVVQQQQDLFYINKKLLEVATYLDQITDQLSILAQASEIIGSKVAKISGDTKALKNSAINNMVAQDE